eukprot:SAG31_NODE_36312_length_314_cov_1.172093_1_plen_64_part_01
MDTFSYAKEEHFRFTVRKYANRPVTFIPQGDQALGAYLWANRGESTGAGSTWHRLAARGDHIGH